MSKWISRSLVGIVSFIAGNFVYFISKLSYFLVPGVDTYGGPNFFLFVIGNSLALWVIYKVSMMLLPGETLPIYFGIVLYLIYSIVRLALLAEVQIIYFPLIVVLCGLAGYLINKKMNP